MSSVSDKKLLVAMRLGETPVPIPNTMVKTQTADGTLLETARESRWLPDKKKNSENSEWKKEKFLFCLDCFTVRVFLENCIHEIQQDIKYPKLNLEI